MGRLDGNNHLRFCRNQSGKYRFWAQFLCLIGTSIKRYPSSLLFASLSFLRLSMATLSESRSTNVDDALWCLAGFLGEWMCLYLLMHP
jgi:hypothetical protein